ncbi:MAG: SRPBCC domain-containing protein [Chloroflexota bacterium]
MSYNWTKFKKQVFINASVEDVFDAWAIPNELIKWFIAKADYQDGKTTPREPNYHIEDGDLYEWKWHQDLEAAGEVKEVIPNERLVFTFGKQAPHSDEDVLVTVEVNAEQDGYTKLSLTQENMADTPYGHRYHLSCNLGWSFFMTNLKGVLEHGVDLREFHPDRVDAARAISVT